MPSPSRPVKPFLPITGQITLLEQRGMTIADPDQAARWLAAVGYYRLSGYSHPFRNPDPADRHRRLDTFSPKSSFREVAGLYEFDRHLKTLILSGLERVEIAMRSQIGYTLGKHDPLAHKDPALFRPTFGHTWWLSKAEQRVDRSRGRDVFVDHHDALYGGDLPIWVLTDVLDFADISKLFAGMRSADQHEVMRYFSITAPPAWSKGQLKRWRTKVPLSNWLLHLTVVRNICAHHGRLWNRQLTPVGTPPLAGLPGFDGLPQDQFEHVYGTICLIAFLLRTTSPGSTWIDQVQDLVVRSFAGFEHRTVREMGFPRGWEQLPLWEPRS